MNENSFIEFSGREAICDPLTDLQRLGARQLIMHTVEAEARGLRTGIRQLSILKSHQLHKIGFEAIGRFAKWLER